MTEALASAPVLTALNGQPSVQATSPGQGVLTLAQCFNDEGEDEEFQEDGIELFGSREEARESLQAAKQALHFVPARVHLPVVYPKVQAAAAGRNDGNEAEFENQLAGVVVLIEAIHHRCRLDGGLLRLRQELAADKCVMGPARRERESNGRSSIHGNQMSLRGPAASGLANRLRADLFRAAVPSGRYPGCRPTGFSTTDDKEANRSRSIFCPKREKTLVTLSMTFGASG